MARVITQILRKHTFRGVKPFLCALTEAVVLLRKQKHIILTAISTVELSVTNDAGLPFVHATYRLEGDGSLVLFCYDSGLPPSGI